jgi:hypothetical protein
VKVQEIKKYLKMILVSAGLGAVAAYISSKIQEDPVPIRIETIRAICRNGQIEVPRVFSREVRNGEILPDYPIIEFFKQQGINVRQNMQIEIKYPTNCVAQREERELARRRFPTKRTRENPFGTISNIRNDGSGWGELRAPRTRIPREETKIRLR